MESLSRPLPPRSVTERVRAWLEWFGVGRLIGASVATLIVCLGAYWLVRMPPPSTEASLPRAATTVESAVSIAPSSDAVPTTLATTAVVVHVAGAVAVPGVYELPPGARVRDAVAAAGGPTPDANWDALNLAAVVVDASRVYVPLVGEEVAPGSALGDGQSSPVAPVGPIDVNLADVALLETLPGVGPATAAAIVTERERNGPFLGVDDLDRVPGIGPAKLAALRDLVTT